MLSNLRAAQALNAQRLATAARRHPDLRYGDRIPDWVTSNIIRLNTARRPNVGSHERQRTRRVA